MSEPIALEFSGDCWYNPIQFQEKLNAVSESQPAVLDLRSEGPSLQSMGVCDIINQWLVDRKQSPNKVQLLRWSNPVEYVPYRRIRCNNLSHFFPMSRDYWLDSANYVHRTENLFGLFVGRMTWSRAVIMHQVHAAEFDIFASRMHTPVPMPWQMPDQDLVDLESAENWVSPAQQYTMSKWYDENNIPSIDHKSVRDQYITPESYIETNSSLLHHYYRFAIELVCETYTQGNTFFPTEKTVRPIMAMKPFIVYGPRYFLARLRTLGFRTYHNIWDESYDLHQGLQRWQMIQTVMKSLNQQSKDQQQAMLNQAKEIAEHNRERLREIAFQQIDLNKHDYKNF